MSGDNPGDPVTAVDVLRGFNADGGVADEMAAQVAEAAVVTANAPSRAGLVAMSAEDGPRAISAVRERAPTSLVPQVGGG